MELFVAKEEDISGFGYTLDTCYMLVEYINCRFCRQQEKYEYQLLVYDKNANKTTTGKKKKEKVDCNCITSSVNR